jgi:pimeloyl-ACP methyl ester carboxylesterase
VNQLPFEIHGPETGAPPIVLVPGGLSGWVSWKPHAALLAQDHRVVRVQLLNMAAAERKEAPPLGYSLRTETEALRATVDALVLGKIHLVGWSHGGAVSLDFALNEPARIQTLTLIEPAAYWVGRPSGLYADEEASFRKLLEGLHDPVSEDDLIMFLNMGGLVPPGADPRRLPSWPVWNALKNGMQHLHTLLDHSDELSRLQRLRGVPVLLVKGKDSVGFDAGVIDILANGLGPTAKVLVLPDAHASHIVAMDQFIAALKGHIAAA